jgi:hypothetical protein
MPRNRAPPSDYVLEGSTKDVHRYSTPALRELVRELGEAALLLEQARIPERAENRAGYGCACQGFCSMIGIGRRDPQFGLPWAPRDSKAPSGRHSS